MSISERFSILIKSIRQMGWEQVSLYGAYQLGLRSGYYRWRSPIQSTDGVVQPANLETPGPQGPFDLLDAGHLRAIQGEKTSELLAEAEALLESKVCLFGTFILPLDLSLSGPLAHWSEYERGKKYTFPGPHGNTDDIKWIWEPARFGWVFSLGRAFQITRDERFALAFWREAQTFWQANPPNLGPQWASGQEVALRLLSLIFARQVFQNPASPHSVTLDGWIAAHARRIPLTLVYARAQNNNHLLSEALGLYAAGVILAGSPIYAQEARGWRQLGWKWTNWGFQHQIKADGTYVQHSTNYHRLMLQLGLWAFALARMEGTRLPEATLEKLRAAVGWFYAQTDPTSGEMINLGANDGANILPLAQAKFRDARPTLQAASLAFCERPLVSPGSWDEMAAWLGLQAPAPAASQALPSPDHSLARIDAPGSTAWAAIRAVHFEERPSHADQLHVELWWQGINLARDAGTYLYNAPSPWNNSLASTAVHNTVLVDGKDQMLRAGRFLWLDWAQARLTGHESDMAGGWERVTAEQDGYRALGIRHQRTLERHGAQSWRVIDRFIPISPRAMARHHFQLQWLLPDWPWKFQDSALFLESEHGAVTLKITAFANPESPGLPVSLQLVRAGEMLKGEGPADIRLGWYSSTYAVREPALSLLAGLRSSLPVCFLSEWILPNSTD